MWDKIQNKSHVCMYLCVYVFVYVFVCVLTGCTWSAGSIVVVADGLSKAEQKEEDRRRSNDRL